MKPSRLGELRKSLEDMTPDEKLALIRTIRSDRCLTKERPAVRKAAARSKDKDKTQLDKLLAGLSPEEIASLLRETPDASEGNSTI